ncbi:MAG TPA: hypothetical protein VGO91_03815 [Pyrinomonadaceae bacterium]|jgi:hypothetical protein|nr:hypothetical protein [Pyrinomonadaceae bacterium]
MNHLCSVARLAVLCLLAFCLPVKAQTPTTKDSAAPAKKPVVKKDAREKADPLASERQAVAASLVTALAEDARSFRDETLRARVQARAADALWESDPDKARTLFRRAWETAEIVDAELARRAEDERRAQTSLRDVELRRSGPPPNVRPEVLRLASRRDRALAEEFIAKLAAARDRENGSLTSGPGQSPTPSDGSDNTQAVEVTTPNPERPPTDIIARLDLAREFLDDGDVDRALLFADKALDRVTTKGINFLSALREKNPAASDQRYARMLQLAASDPQSDAVTVSVLSSYAFTPFLYVIVARDNNHTSQQREHIVAPTMPQELRAAFFRAAAQILLRPVAPPDQDHTLAGRKGLYFTIARLLPFFDQFDANLAAELRNQMGTVAADAPEDIRNGKNPNLTRGLTAEDPSRNDDREALERADRAPTAEERDGSFARAAMAAARKGDAHARDYVDKISDTDLRTRARAHVDFTLVSRALDGKDPQEALRLARMGELTHIHRAWALTEIARLFAKSDPTRATEVLDEAATEARRIGGSDPDRARALVGVATQMFAVDHNRVWELMTEAAKAANSATDFTGEDAEIVSRLTTGRGSSTNSFSANSFDLAGIFGLLAKDDLYRAIELARNFNGESPRAVATLAIAHAVLEKKKA